MGVQSRPVKNRKRDIEREKEKENTAKMTNEDALEQDVNMNKAMAMGRLLWGGKMGGAE